MPYKIENNCVKKADTGETVPGGCHKTHEEALAHQRALEVNVKDSAFAEFSMRITKAAYNKSENEPMKWAAIDSDTDEDLYAEKMSPELYKDFVARIENNTPIPEQFHDAVCEQDWCGGMPYLSVAHYKAGTGKVNVPGEPTSVFVDGTRLKSKGILHDTEMGRRVFKELCRDEIEKKSNPEHQPIRISIGFLDLEHKHLAPYGGQEFTFTRTDVGQICPLCSQGVGGKIYTKGQLIHLAMTRVPVNPRTEMVAEKSMDAIQTKRDDAKSIIGDLADELEEKSIASDILVVRSDGDAPKDDPSDLSKCYDPNTDSFNQKCIDGVMNKYMASIRNEIGTAVKSLVRDEVDALVVEDAKRKDVTPADKKQAEKEYGDVAYADETNKKYPIDTKEHAKAALSYWGMPKNREKYSPEDQKRIGGRIRATAKKFGIEVTDKKSDVVEESMDGNVEKMVAGGESVPEKPFKFTQDGVTVTGDGNNTIANPIKAQADDGDNDADDNGGKETAADKKQDAKKEMSTLDKSFEALKSTLANAKSVEDVQKAFNELGTEVEKAYAPEQKPVDASNIAEIVRSAVEQAVAPLKVEIATLKAQGNTVSTDAVTKSKGLQRKLTINDFVSPGQMIQKAENEPKRNPNDTVPMQIRSIARKSTGLQ